MPQNYINNVAIVLCICKLLQISRHEKYVVQNCIFCLSKIDNFSKHLPKF